MMLMQRRDFIRHAGFAGLMGLGVVPGAFAAATLKPDAKSALLVIDVQNCFVTGGTLPVKDGEQVAHAVAAGHVPERAVLELAGQADQGAFAVGLDPVGAAERRHEALRHLAAERLEGFHHRRDVLDVAAGVGVLHGGRAAATAQRQGQSRAVVVPDVFDRHDDLAHVDLWQRGGGGDQHGADS